MHLSPRCIVELSADETKVLMICTVAFQMDVK